MIWAILFQKTASKFAILLSTTTRPFIRHGIVAHKWNMKEKIIVGFLVPNIYAISSSKNILFLKSGIVCIEMRFSQQKTDQIWNTAVGITFTNWWEKMCLSGEISGNKMVRFWLQVPTRQGWHKYPIFQLHKRRSSKQNYHQVRSHSGSFF